MYSWQAVKYSHYAKEENIAKIWNNQKRWIHHYLLAHSMYCVWRRNMQLKHSWSRSRRRTKISA